MEIQESSDPRDEFFMREALKEAQKAYDDEEVPVGAILVSNGRIIAKGHNQTEQLNDVTAHAEMIAITAASEALGGKYLPQCTLYVTVEPCVMCAGALGWSQIGRIVFGASDPKRGFINFCNENLTPLHVRTQVTSGVLENECSELITRFFKNKRR